MSLFSSALRLVFCLLLLQMTADAADLNGYGATVYPWVMIVLVLVAIGLLTVIIVEFIIVYKVIKLGGVPWRSIWLGQTLLFAIFLSYITLIAFIFKPTPTSCSVIRFGVGVCYALMLSVLFVKVLILLSPKTQAGFLKFGHQILILLILWAIQIAINAEWIILSPSQTSATSITVEIDNGVSTRQEQYEGMVCKPALLSSLFFDFMASFVFIMLLRVVVLGVTLITYSRSKKQEGKASSESKWIMVTTIVTTLIWIIWILVGALLPDASMAALAIGFWATATAKLVIMFIPKLHKLATLKDGEFYYEDEIPGMVAYDEQDGGIEMDPDPEHHSVIAPPSYQAESVLYAPSEPDTGTRLHMSERAPSWNELSAIPQYPRSRLRSPPSIILEEKSNLSSMGRSPSVILKHDNTEKVHYTADPNALELQHPTSRLVYPQEQYTTLSHIGELSSSRVPPQRYYTIGGHGRRGSSSVIGVPRYERRYMPANINPLYSSPVPEPGYVHEVIRPTSASPASVISSTRQEGATLRYINGYTNPSFVLESSPHVHTAPHTKKMTAPKAASVVGVPRYEPRVVMSTNPEVRMNTPRRTASYQDIRGGNIVQLQPQRNGYSMTGSLPRPTKILYKQTPNGKLIPVEQRTRAYSDDILERRSVY